MNDNSSSEYMSAASNNLPNDFKGVIYSFTIVHVGFGHMADKAPYALCQVEVNESGGSDSDINSEIVLGVCLDKEFLDHIQIGLPVQLQYHEDLGYQVSI